MRWHFQFVEDEGRLWFLIVAQSVPIFVLALTRVSDKHTEKLNAHLETLTQKVLGFMEHALCCRHIR